MMLCFFRPYELQVEKFAELWTAYEHEYKAHVLIAGKVEMSDIVDDIVNKCHVALIHMTGMHCCRVQLVFFCRIIVPTILRFVVACAT